MLNLPAKDSPAVTRISSRITFFYKRVFPAIWFGFLGFFVCIGGANAIGKQQFLDLIPLIVAPLVMAIGGYAIMKWVVFNLVDEVWDCGDSILIKNKEREYQFPVSEFISVGYTGYMNPPRITLSLRETSEDLGTEIAFIPPFRLFPYSMPPLARDLMLRIDEARRIR
jgi:hypothetical protein